MTNGKVKKEIFILIMTLFLFSGPLQSQQIERPIPEENGRSLNIVDFPDDMMVNIMATKNNSLRNSQV